MRDWRGPAPPPGQRNSIVTSASTSSVATVTLLRVTPPRLANFQLRPDGSCKITITCDPKSSLTIQGSTNLVDWSNLVNVPGQSAATFTLTINNIQSPGINRRFLRTAVYTQP